MLTIGNTTKRATDWARAYGIGTGHIYDRLKAGMPVEQAITTPVGRRGVKIRKHNSLKKGHEPNDKTSS